MCLFATSSRSLLLSGADYHMRGGPAYKPHGEIVRQKRVRLRVFFKTGHSLMF